MPTKRRHKKRRSSLGNSPTAAVNSTLVKAMGEIEESIALAKMENCSKAFSALIKGTYLLGKSSNSNGMDKKDIEAKLYKAKSKVEACITLDPSLQDD